MPLNVTIDVNGQPIVRMRITRLDPVLESADQISTYHVQSETLDVRSSKRAEFVHAYSDGAAVCVERALAALREESNATD